MDTLNHVSHAVILTVVLYFIKTILLKQSTKTALDHSVVIGSIALIYMIFFGHNFPPKF
jgi:putative effector of murein hydrolase